MGPDYLKFSVKQGNKIGAPKVKKVSPPARAIPVCSKCRTLLGKGVSHICSKVQKQENILKIVRSSSRKSKSKVTSKILKGICSDDGVSTSGGTVSLSTGGTLLQVQVGKPRITAKVPRFSHESLKRLQTVHNFSDR